MKLEGLRTHLVFGAGIAALFGAAGYLAQGRVAHPYSAILWAAASVLVPIITLVALNYGVAQFERSIPFAALSLLLAALFGIATERLSRRTLAPGGAAASAIYACGAVAALALALAFALERGWLTVALSLMVPGIAYIADRRPLPMLRQLCIVLTLLVMARILHGSAHRRRPCRQDAHSELAALGLWRAGVVVLGRRHDPAQARR